MEWVELVGQILSTSTIHSNFSNVDRTKTGDSGETSLMYGRRVSKADPRVDAYGCVDELNAALGLARVIGRGSL